MQENRKSGNIHTYIYICVCLIKRQLIFNKDTNAIQWKEGRKDYIFICKKIIFNPYHKLQSRITQNRSCL